MKETGVVRRLDELGRVVIPKEIRKRLKINNGDMVDIFVSNDKIVLQKYNPFSSDLLPISAMITAVKNVYECDITIFDKSKIICSTIQELKNDSFIDDSFVKRIEGSLEKELSSNLKLNIIDSYVFDNDIYVESLFINYEFYGYILISSEIITKKDKEAIYIVQKYFDNFYQNQ